MRAAAAWSLGQIGVTPDHAIAMTEANFLKKAIKLFRNCNLLTKLSSEIDSNEFIKHILKDEKNPQVDTIELTSINGTGVRKH